MRKAHSLAIIIFCFLFFSVVTPVYSAGYCTGGTWEGYAKRPGSCNDPSCIRTGFPDPDCVCTLPFCDTSYTLAGEPPCGGNTQEYQCSTPAWECSNGVSCNWIEIVPTNTPRPVGPTNTPGGPTNTPPALTFTPSPTTQPPNPCASPNSCVLDQPGACAAGNDRPGDCGSGKKCCFLPGRAPTCDGFRLNGQAFQCKGVGEGGDAGIDAAAINVSREFCTPQDKRDGKWRNISEDVTNSTQDSREARWSCDGGNSNGLLANPESSTGPGKSCVVKCPAPPPPICLMDFNPSNLGRLLDPDRFDLEMKNMPSHCAYAPDPEQCERDNGPWGEEDKTRWRLGSSPTNMRHPAGRYCVEGVTRGNCTSNGIDYTSDDNAGASNGIWNWQSQSSYENLAPSPATICCKGWVGLTTDEPAGAYCVRLGQASGTVNQRIVLPNSDITFTFTVKDADEPPPMVRLHTWRVVESNTRDPADWSVFWDRWIAWREGPLPSGTVDSNPDLHTHGCTLNKPSPFTWVFTCKTPINPEYGTHYVVFTNKYNVETIVSYELVATIPPIVGRHDDANCSTTWGWACDPDDYSKPLGVDLCIDGDRSSGSCGGPFSAGVLRADVASSCGGNPNHGFSIPIPDILRDGLPHTLYIYAKNIGAGTDQLLSNSPRTITCIPDPWYKLSGASLYKNGSIDNFIPANPLAFDGTDTIERQLIVRGTNPPRITQEGVVLSSSYVNLGTSVEISTNQWGRANYTRTSTYLSNLNSFIEYIKLRKKFKVITNVTQMESGTINLLIGNVTISNPGQINGSIDNAVLLVQGNITLDINNQFNPSNNSLALIATGNIDIHSRVREIHGILIANTIDISYDGPSTRELKVMGNLITTNDIDAIGLKRNRTEWRQPSLFIQFDPNMYVDLLIPLSTIIQEGRTIE